jgi:hypothetical protein
MKKLLCRAATVILFLLLAFQSSALISQNVVEAAGSPNLDVAYKDSLAVVDNGRNKITVVDVIGPGNATSTPTDTNETETPPEITPDQSSAPTENPNGLHLTDFLPIIAVGAIIAIITVPLVLLRKRTYLVSFGQVGIGHDYNGPVVIIDGVNCDKYGTSFGWKAKSIHSFEYITPLNGSTGRQYVLSSISGLANERNYFTVIGNNTIVGNYNLQFKIQVFEARPNPKRKPFYTP